MTQWASHELTERILQLAIDIQQVAAPTFSEARRAAFVAQEFEKADLSDVEVDATGNVYARRIGNTGPAVVVSAHLDTVFPQDTDLAVTRTPDRIAGPGIGDNALAVAALLGLAWVLEAKSVPLTGDLWLVANVGEEGLGDLKGMRAVVDRFQQRASAYLVLEGLGLGSLVTQGIGARRYAISVEAEGGHSWGDFGNDSAVHTLVRLATQLTDLSVPQTPKTTFNVGVVEGGTSVNTIAERAKLLLDLRSESAAELDKLDAQVNDLLAACDAGSCTVHADLIGDRPSGSLDPHHPLALLVERTLQSVGFEEIDRRPSSTDANIPLSRQLPALCLGLTHGGNPHRLNEYIETKPFDTGFGLLVRVVLGAFELTEGQPGVVQND